MEICCSECGEPVSDPVPEGTVVAAYILCAACLEKVPEQIANDFFFWAGYRRLLKLVGPVLAQATQETPVA